MMMAQRNVLVWVCLVVLSLLAMTGIHNIVSVSAADDESSESTTTEGGGGGQAAAPTPPAEDEPLEDMNNRKLAREYKDDFDVKSHFDWGTYYDPKSIFCGPKYDCYGILGFDYESFNNEKPTQKQITKRYRAISRHWHPDKSKHKDAKERFVKIARAYEVLTKDESRKEYDMMRYNQEAYYKKYGSDVMFSFAPKTDTLLVIIFVLLIVNGFVYFAQYNKWHKVCSRLAKAAVEDWNPSQGGTVESKELRDHAIQLFDETTKSDVDDEKTTTSKDSKKKSSKTTTKEKKEKLNDELRPIIEKLAYDIIDFGAGFHKPTWKDLVMIKLAIFPYHFIIGMVWQIQYWINRIQKIPLSENEKMVLTERSVGHIIWEFATDDDKTQMIKRELWLLKNLKEWNDEREFAKLSKKEQKQYKEMMKREKQN